MAKTLSAWAETDFGKRVKHVYQARERLKGTSRERVGKFEMTKFPVMGVGTARRRTAPQVKLELMDVVASRVPCTMTKWNASEMTDIWDQSEVPIDERDQLAKVIAGGLGRRRDQIRIDAMIAFVTAGVGVKSVATSVGGANTGLNMAKIMAAHEQLGLDEVDGNLHIAVHVTDIRMALSTVEFGSADYNSLRLLEQGGLKDGMTPFGFHWHILGDRAAEGGLAIAATIRQGFAWAEDALGIAKTPVQEHDTTWLGDYASWITSGFEEMGGCVIDGKGVVEILMDE